MWNICVQSLTAIDLVNTNFSMDLLFGIVHMINDKNSYFNDNHKLCHNELLFYMYIHITGRFILILET